MSEDITTITIRGKNTEKESVTAQVSHFSVESEKRMRIEKIIRRFLLLSKNDSITLEYSHKNR